MKTEAELGVMKPQVKEGQQSPTARRGKECILPKSLWREFSPADNLISDFWPLELR